MKLYIKKWGNGRLMCLKLTYQDGTVEVKWWLEDGQLMTHEFFKDGKRDGECKEWWGNGQLKYQGFFKDGKPEGELKMWFEDGQLWYQLVYKDGKLEGERKEWNENGQLENQLFYKDGECISPILIKYDRVWYRLQTLWREYKERERIWYRKMAYFVASKVLNLPVTNGLVGEIANAV